MFRTSMTYCETQREEIFNNVVPVVFHAVIQMNGHWSFSKIKTQNYHKSGIYEMFTCIQ